MQNRSKILVLSVSVVMLAACSSMQEKSAYAVPQRVNLSGVEVDEVYVAMVDAQARKNGANVIWVNLPTKPVKRVATTE